MTGHATGGPKRSPLVFRSHVVALSLGGVTLRPTQFQPRLIDREPDLGAVAGMRVVDVAEGMDGEVVHVVDEPAGLSDLRLCQVVTAEVDLNRREQLSRLHSAVHLLYFGFSQLYGPARRARRLVGAERAVIDLTSAHGATADRDELQSWLDVAIADDLTIAVREHGGRRFWHVDGVGTLACSGLHPESTIDLGQMRVSMASELRSTRRIRLVVRPGLEVG